MKENLLSVPLSSWSIESSNFLSYASMMKLSSWHAALIDGMRGIQSVAGKLLNRRGRKWYLWKQTVCSMNFRWRVKKEKTYSLDASYNQRKPQPYTPQDSWLTFKIGLEKFDEMELSSTPFFWAKTKLAGLSCISVRSKDIGRSFLLSCPFVLVLSY